MVNVSMQDFHQLVFGGQFQLLDAPFFEFLFGAEMDFIAEGFELVFELDVFCVQNPEFVVIVHQLLDELFVSSLHGLSLAAAFGGAATGLNVASAVRT
jgi:hypothetical protein